MYQDKDHDDNAEFYQIYESIAERNAKHKVTSMQWFTIDTLKYPELEDPRDERAIFSEEGTLKSLETGRPQGSYISVLYGGNRQTIEFTYDSLSGVEANRATLRDMVVSYIHPVQRIKVCSDIMRFITDPETK